MNTIKKNYVLLREIKILVPFNVKSLITPKKDYIFQSKFSHLNKNI